MKNQNALLATAKSRNEYDPHRTPKAAHIIGGLVVVALTGYLAVIVLFSI